MGLWGNASVHPNQAQRSLGEGRERMRQRCVRTLWCMMCMGMPVGMAACSGVPRGPASSFEAAVARHHSGPAAVSAGGDAAVRPLPQPHPSSECGVSHRHVLH
jgi:hypothetical protein